MKKIFLIGTGGFLGAILRFVIKNIHIYHYKEIIPINTLLINVLGSFFIALILTAAFEVWQMDDVLRLGIATGFIGAFTTFSTLCKETFQLMDGGYYYSAVSYMTMSIVLGLAAVYFGTVVSREVISKVLKDSSKEAA